MRYFVPTRVHTFEEWNAGDPWYMCTAKDQGPRETTVQYVAPGSALEEADDPSFFWNTHGREFNDCVHAKLVDYDGNPVGVPVKAKGYNLYQSFVCPSGLWSEQVEPRKRWRWGLGAKIVNGSMTNHAFSVGVSLAKASNSGYGMKLKFHIRAWSGFDYHIYRYGNKTNDLEIEFRAIITETVYRQYRRIKPSTYVVRYNPYNIDFSMLASAVQALQENMKFLWDPNYSDYDQVEDCSVYEQIIDTAFPLAETIYRQMVDVRFGGLTAYTYKPALTSPVQLPAASDAFVLHEPEIVAYGTDPYLVSAGQDFSQYWWNVLIQEAYLDALNSVPKLNDNSISNILEIAGFIKSLVIDHKVEIPKSLSSIWLSYRYQYMTTKLDAEEAIDFVHRHLTLGTLDKWISCFGKSKHDYEGVSITCRCGLDIRPSEVALLQKVWRALYTYGLQPNFYVIWDMIPYSFIVDWFLPIGRMASVLDAKSNYSETYYEIKNVQFSFSYDIPNQDMLATTFHCYTRFLSPGVVTLNGYYFFEEDPASTRVIGYRVLDTLSLILGRR